jgi:hypothetical protein
MKSGTESKHSIHCLEYLVIYEDIFEAALARESESWENSLLKNRRYLMTLSLEEAARKKEQ